MTNCELATRIISGIVIVFFVTSVVLGTNIIMVKIVCNTFDFWFKMWNLLLWMISLLWLSIGRSKIALDFGVGIIGPTIGCGSLFLLDAMPLTYQLKETMSFIAAFLVLIGAIESYFVYDDILYNPFKSWGDHIPSTISVKSIHLGAYFNIFLFTVKPIFSHCGRIVARYVCCGINAAGVVGETPSYSNSNMKSDNNKNKNTREQHERLVSVYKRPKVKWIK